MANKQFAATGYPAPHPATGDPIPAPDSLIMRLLHIIAIAILCGFFIFFILCLVNQIFYQPKDPEFRINSLSLTGLNVSSFTVSGNWTASLTVVNPNKKFKISYSDVHAAVYYQHVMVATATMNLITPFHQETRSTANVSLAFVATKPFVDGPVLDRTVYDRSEGKMEFEIRVYASATRWSARTESFKAVCEHLPLDVSSSLTLTAGELIGGPIPCH